MSVSQSPACVLCLDVGSQSIRAQLFGRQQALTPVWRRRVVSAHPGQLDAEDLFRELVDLIDEFSAAHPSAMAGCRAIAVTAQRATQVFLDQHGKPVANAVTWEDAEPVEPPPMRQPWRHLLGWTGHLDTVEGMRRQAPAWKLHQRHPDAWQRCRRSCLLSGWLNYRLSGRFSDCAQAQIGYVPLRHRQQRWALPGHWMWGALPTDRGMLPSLVPAGQAIGVLEPTLARRWRVPAETPVVACAGDKAAEALGAGCLHSATAVASLGTQITVHQPLLRYRPADPPWPLFAGARPGSYLDEIDTELSARRARELATRVSQSTTPEDDTERLLGSGTDNDPRVIAYRDYLNTIGGSLLGACSRLGERNGSAIGVLRLTGGLSQSNHLLDSLQQQAGQLSLRVERLSPDTGMIGVAITAWHAASGEDWLSLLADLYPLAETSRPVHHSG